MSARGRFIALEGGEGAGKSTQARLLTEHLRAQGLNVIQTREPGGSPLAEAIRGVVLGDWAEGINPTTELLLIFAARAAHVAATIRPALARGDWVICDRFVDASWAYQGAGRGIPMETMAAMEKLVLEDLHPDLTLVFDLDVATGLTRAQRRGEVNRFEAESLDFLQRVRQRYLDRAAAEPQRYAVINAAEKPEAVTACILKILERWA